MICNVGYFSLHILIQRSNEWLCIAAVLVHFMLCHIACVKFLGIKGDIFALILFFNNGLDIFYVISTAVVSSGFFFKKKKELIKKTYLN